MRFLALLLLLMVLLSTPVLAQDANYPTLAALADLDAPPFRYTDMIDRMSWMNPNHVPPTQPRHYEVGDREWFRLSYGKERDLERMEMELRGQTARVLLWIHVGVDYPRWRADALAKDIERLVLNPIQKLFQFSEPPGVDGDPRLYIAMISDPEGDVLGYFPQASTRPQRLYFKSNEREMLVVNLALDDDFDFYDEILSRSSPMSICTSCIIIATSARNCGSTKPWPVTPAIMPPSPCLKFRARTAWPTPSWKRCARALRNGSRLKTRRPNTAPGSCSWCISPNALTTTSWRACSLSGPMAGARLIKRCEKSTLTTTHALNFRATPNGTKIGLLPKGAAVDALDRDGDWYMVIHAGRHGWIHSDYVHAAGNCPRLSGRTRKLQARLRSSRVLNVNRTVAPSPNEAIPPCRHRLDKATFAPAPHNLYNCWRGWRRGGPAGNEFLAVARASCNPTKQFHKRSDQMKTSKLVSLLALLVFLFSLGFAGQAQDATISFLTPSWGVPPSEEALNAFMEESGITVEIQSVQMQDLFSRVQVAAAAGEAAADVIFITEEGISNVVATGNMLPLNDLLDSGDLDLSDFEFLDFFSIDGDRYAVPSYLQLVMVDYNTAKLAEAGFDAPPTTWAEFDMMARAARDAGVDEYPIAMGAIHWSWWLIALSMGDPMFDADLNPVFADEGSKAREAMALLFTWFDDELISPEILAGSISQHSIFWSGVGVFHQGWQGSVRVGNNPDVSAQSPNVAYMVLPEVGNTWNLPAGIGIHVDSENVEAAWEFIQWYVGDQNMTDIYNAFGLYPSRLSISSALNEAGAIEGYAEMVEQGMHVNDLPRVALWWGPWSSSVSENIKEGAATGMSSDEVIDALAAEWNDLKAEYE